MKPRLRKCPPSLHRARHTVSQNSARRQRQKRSVRVLPVLLLQRRLQRPQLITVHTRILRHPEALTGRCQPRPCAPSGQTTFVAVSYLVMTVLALTCAYVNQGLRRSTGIVIIAGYLAFAGVLLVST